MTWEHITTEQQLQAAIDLSQEQPVLLFKHSTRCSISSMALSRLERGWDNAADKAIRPFFIDLIAHRPVSNAVADLTGVKHESPQAIVLHKGQVVYHDSHTGISVKHMLAQVQA